LADRLLIEFDGLSAPVALIDSGAVYDCFPKVFHEWRFGEAMAGASEPVLTVRRDGEHYRIEADWLDRPLGRLDHVDALCGFIAELIQAFVNRNPDLLCLHGAAAEFAGRLVIFPNRYRAGKSVLSACLAATGVRLFADDVLPIVARNDHGMAPGIAPRLRLPLPDNLTDEAREFLELRAVARGERYFYLDLPPGGLAPHGTTAPIGAFVLLERTPDAEPELLEIGESEVLKQVIWQNFAREAEAPEILRRLHGIVGRAGCWRLRYSRAEDAAALLKAHFTGWPESRAAAEPPPRVAADPGSAKSADGPLPGRYQRSPVATATEVDGERFLADADGAAIYHLNPVGSAIWHALAEPTSAEQLVELLHAAFPETDRRRIERDVETLLADLAAKQLVLYGDSDGRRTIGR
jgi:hypothetical protein